MLIYALSLLLGATLFTTKAYLIPSSSEWLLCVVLILIIVWLWYKKHPKGAWAIVCLLVGYAWLGFFSYQVINERVGDAYLNKAIDIVGEVVELPSYQSNSVRLLLQVNEPFTGRIRLNWYATKTQTLPPINAGDVWQLKVKLKANNGFQNPHGFDYEKWLFANRIGATGYVLKKGDNRLLLHKSSLQSWRNVMQKGLIDHLQPLDYDAFILALAMGDRSLMSDDDWTVLTRTNTSHLTVVSGLHIGLIAGFIFLLFKWLWQRSATLCLYLPAQTLAAYAAILAAFVYALMAGFSVPTQRAVIMISIAFSHFIIGRYHTMWTLYAYALIAVLMINPLSVLSVGFWLSFAAVFVILYGLYISVGRPWYQRILLMQLMLFAGLLPLLALFFQNVSLSAPLANILAVPYVSFLVLPIVLIGVMFHMMDITTIAVSFFALADYCLAYLLIFLTWLSKFEWLVVSPVSPTMLVVMLAMVGVLIIMLPAALKLRRFGVVLLLPIFLSSPVTLEQNQFKLTVLDAGQSLAVLIRTQNHTMIYDSGFATRSGFNIGKAVIVPQLRGLGIHSLDKVMISHSDNDHIGGLAALNDAMVIQQILTSEPAKIISAKRCYQGLTWHWDGVDFEVLSPRLNTSLIGNNGSCVLKISTAKRSVLLTADIEQKAETVILDTQRHQLAADVMLMPHHGSLTSSSDEFIDAVSPQLTLVSTGYRNRFNFPKEAIIKRYKKRGITVLDTQCSGAIELTVDENVTVSEYRHNQRRYWLRQC